jgi:catechol 2,3-dioxygenase-like lactoylglutathione lyase family enzyme
MMRILRTDHVQVAMPSGKEEAARAFYAGLLGMREVPKPVNLAKRGGCWFESGETRLHLGAEKDFSAARKAHPAFVVDDLEAARQMLARAGLECLDDEPIDGYLRTYVFDPFGNRIELMQAADG